MNHFLRTLGVALVMLTAAATAQAATLSTVTPVTGGPERSFDVTTAYLADSDLFEANTADFDVLIGGRISETGAAFDPADADLAVLDPLDFSPVLTGSLTEARISNDLIELLYGVTTDTSAGGIYGAFVRATLAFAPGTFTAANALMVLNDTPAGLEATATLTAVAEVAPIPLPATLPLLISALGLVAAVGRRRSHGRRL